MSTTWWLSTRQAQLACFSSFLLPSLSHSFNTGFPAATLISEMGRASPRLPTFCLNRITTHVRVRQPPEAKPISDSVKTDKIAGFLGTGNPSEKLSSEPVKQRSVNGRRIMIVVDSSPEAKCALQWALSHTVQNQDTIILLYVARPCKQGDGGQMDVNPKDYELPYTMKKTCHMKKPEVEVEVSVVQGKDKGPTIVTEARKQGVSLLVLGQRKRSMTWRLLLTWAGSKVGGGVVEYCIQNADCMTLAVRRKSRKVGGYLITTRRHKDFWLLA